MQKSVLILLTTACGALLLASCASHPIRPSASQAAAAAAAAKSAQTAGAAGSSASGAASAAEVPANGPAVPGPSAGLLQQRTIYFDFDKSAIKPQFDALIAAHAQYLQAHPNIRVRLEGNTDNRGSPEYNIGLGWRRAQAVRQALMLQGVMNDQIAMVSYGEERPAVLGNNAAAWAKNRRVDIVYLN